jgi:hypothetical protein
LGTLLFGNGTFFSITMDIEIILYGVKFNEALFDQGLHESAHLAHGIALGI